ncbi:acid protease [Cryphonectria parasitica EP155]|uniref:Acid protease n=1 Tax=Cryphonectria parasitica (strain ATCC 38755 / EP155) TaxID=660469 RepID=A0A9P4Y739_CRYP1|nr:acid protease [Cryphonectria parasitica EP155]KAF3767941.1 acid protease [Cryphonectria parasitica EP155]
MQSLIRAVLFLGFLAAMVAAAPSPNIQKRGVYSVERVRNVNFKGHNGPRQYLKSLRKFRLKVPPALMDAIRNQSSSTTTLDDKLTNSAKVDAATNTTNAATNTTSLAAGTGLVAATPEQGDVEYLAPVNIGGQTINLDFDSGSSDLWVFNTQLAAADTAGHTLYNPTNSSTFAMMNGATFSISYGDGSGAAGNVGTDTVNIGGATVTQQAIEMATAVSQSFIEDTNSNGLVGLAYSKLNTVQPQQQKTFFDNAMATLAEPVFTADLRKASVGAYTFGAIDATKFNGTMSWAAVNTTMGFWQFSSTKFAVGTGAAQAANPTGQAIADTGTTLIIADPTIVNGYYSQIPSAQNNAQAGGVTVDCNATLPDLMLDVGGTMARVRGEDINFAQVQGNTCFGGVQAGSAGEMGIYGDIFFKSQFVAFNGGNNSLGFAEHQ